MSAVLELGGCMNESSDDEAARLEQMGLYTSALPNQVTAILNAGDRTERVAQITASAQCCAVPMTSC